MDPNNTHEVIFWDNLYKLRPWLNMDHMRISGTEPSSVILSQKSISKVEKRCPKGAKTS